MQRLSLAGVLVLAFAGAAAAQTAAPAPIAPPLVTVDSAKLRTAIYLPEIQIQFNWYENLPGTPEVAATSKKLDDAQQIAELEKQLDGTIGDVETYFEIAGCYEKLKDKAGQGNAYRKIEEWLRPHLQKSDSRQGRLLSRYALALSWFDAARLDEAETWARKAVELAPEDWHCWSELGSISISQTATILCGLAWRDKLPITTQSVAQMLSYNPPTQERAAAAAHRLLDIRDCADKVLQRAPRQVEALSAYLGLRMWDACLLAPMAALGKVPMPITTIHPAAELALHCGELADLCPDKFSVQAMAAFLLMSIQSPETGKADVPMTALPPDVRQTMQKYFDRLAKLGESSDRKIAVQSLMVLAGFQFLLLKDPKVLEQHARRILKLDPARLEAHEYLQSSLVHQKRYAAAIEEGMIMVKCFPTPRSHFLLAKTLSEADQLDEAEKALRAGLRLSPDDLYCNLGLVAVLLRHGPSAERRAEAERVLARARTLFRSDSPATLGRDYEFLNAVQLALNGSPEASRFAMRRLVDQNPNVAGLRQALAAFAP
jgi:tetratricopeptide (TPR) repeat protein